MQSYFTYLEDQGIDTNWGIKLLNVGRAKTLKNQHYPSQKHPAEYFIDWEKGRILNEYQVVYISKGKGIFESKSLGIQEIQSGTIMLLFPGEWHRYKPTYETGWEEHWVGFKGEIIDKFVLENLLTRNNAILNIGMDEQVIKLINTIIDKSKNKTNETDLLLFGLVVQLLGEIKVADVRQKIDLVNNESQTINRACILMRKNVLTSLSMQEVAKEINVSYSWFRKAFKKWKGTSPQKYFTQLKLEKAKFLLKNTNDPIKEISYQLKFDSPQYFSKVFKKIIKVTPETYRKKMITEF